MANPKQECDDSTRHREHTWRGMQRRFGGAVTVYMDVDCPGFGGVPCTNPLCSAGLARHCAEVWCRWSQRCDTCGGRGQVLGGG